ncbi:MAG TPA: type II/IV secretion system ATPase subunit [Candidatus Thermoplasmatota archaeon]|nr:type II/IV secretion system ATPase subunit [Candidatus Thermoplasmatota archaeon]
MTPKDSRTESALSEKPEGADPAPSEPTAHEHPLASLTARGGRGPLRTGPLGRLLDLLRGRVDEPLVPATLPDGITPFPELAPHEKVVEWHPIRPPFAYVRVILDESRGTHRYEVVEPPLVGRDEEVFRFVKDAFLRTLDVDLNALDADGARTYLAEAFLSLARRQRLHLTPLSLSRLWYHLERDFLGFGAIDVILRDPEVEDLSCDGPGVALYTFHRRYGSLKSNVSFATDDALDGFVLQLVQRSGKQITVAEPLADATLPDGSRLQASLSREVTTRGSTFTIRKFREDPLTPPDLVQLGTLSDEMLAYFWFAVEYGASALICGGTASGKTTTLNALSLFIPPDSKIVSIEDTRELNLPHDNWIPGVTRSGAVSGELVDGKRVGAVDMFDLLRAALRQRPEYLLLGEVRGPEALVLFQAMATGHTVFSTIHAESVPACVYRLESKPIEVPRMMLSSLDIVCIQEQDRVGQRRVRRLKEVVEFTGIDPKTGEILTNQVYRWDPARAQFRYLGASYVLQRVAAERRLDEAGLQAEFDRRTRFLGALREKGLRDIVTVGRLLASYAADPAKALAEVGVTEVGLQS